MATLHPKIKALQRRSTSMSYSNVSVNEGGKLAETDLDKRIVKGYLFTWSTINDRREMFSKTAFDKSLQERGPKVKSNMPIKFLAYHNQTKPLSLYDVLEPDEHGLYFETRAVDPVSYSDDILIGLKSGTLNNFSGGFNPVWTKSDYQPDTDTILHRECNLFEGSVVSLSSDENAVQIRSMVHEDEMEEINEEFETFINSLPRPFRLQARGLFARQQSLYLIEPPKQADALDEVKPTKKVAIDYNYLTKNLNKQND